MAAPLHDLERIIATNAIQVAPVAGSRFSAAMGFVQLMAAISPTLARPTGANRLTVNASATKAASLLARVQDSATTLGATVAEMLALALELRDASLEHLCRGELGGWSSEVIEKRPDEKPIHRQIELFASLDSQINAQFFGWGENVANVFNYMRANPDTWTAVRMHVPNPIAELEDLAARPIDLKKGLMSFTLRLGSFLPDAKNPESPVFAYARPDSYIKALAATRAELTKRLLQLLPKADPA